MSHRSSFLGIVLMISFLGWQSQTRHGGPVYRLTEDLVMSAAVDRGEHLTEIRIWLSNVGEESVRFETGARGGPGGLGEPDGDWKDGIGVIGTEPTLLPTVSFLQGSTRISLRPPTLGGPTRRAMRPGFFEIEPGQKRLYARWFVPNRYAAGEFLRARLETSVGEVWCRELTKVEDDKKR